MKVEKYSKFLDVLARLNCQREAIESERSSYLETYLRYLGAKSLFIEDEYIDAGHLKDYSAYYCLRGDSIGKKPPDCISSHGSPSRSHRVSSIFLVDFQKAMWTSISIRPIWVLSSSDR